MVQLFCTVFNSYQSKTAIDRKSEDRKLDIICQLSKNGKKLFLSLYFI